MAPAHVPWWRSAVIYEIYLRSFADGNGDGLGDLHGVLDRMSYLHDLGIDAVWITPFYPSPMADHGYDVADPRAVDPRFGTLTDLDAVVEAAHAVGLRVVVDFVPNHSSSAHPWFEAALAADPGSPERARYLFRSGQGSAGDDPPNNWRSIFGGPAWTRDVHTGEWYLHMFSREQPDLNWRHPDVRADAMRTLRFWLDRGVDGFRIDVAHGLMKDGELRDNPGAYDPATFGHGDEERYSWDQPEVHEIYRDWRALIDTYPHQPVLVGEVWVRDPEALGRYVRPDELHLAFNFLLTAAPFSAPALRDAVDRSLAAMTAAGAPASWVLSNHDVSRVVSRYGGGSEGEQRARAAALFMLALPGVAFVYAGEELGLADAPVPTDQIQDPQWHRSGGDHPTRDPVRVPLPWSGQSPPFGFSDSGDTPWLPQPTGWDAYTVAGQSRDDASTLQLYRAALRLRKQTPALQDGQLEWIDAPPGCLAFRRGDVTCMINIGNEAVPLPAGRILLMSCPAEAGALPGMAATWIADLPEKTRGVSRDCRARLWECWLCSRSQSARNELGMWPDRSPVRWRPGGREG
jgi:alpha-glucosidase